MKLSPALSGSYSKLYLTVCTLVVAR